MCKMNNVPTLKEVLSCKGYPIVKFKDGRLDNIDLFMVKGAITDKERYEAFALSFAHLLEDGNISCHGEIVGTFDDLIVKMPSA